MLAIWIYKRVLLLLIAYGGVLVSLSLFPNVPIWAVSSFLGEILFSPFKLLVAIILFISGFLAYSLFVRDVVIIWKTSYSVPFHMPRMFFVIAACLSWIHLFLYNGIGAFIVLGLALWYGIMDVGIR
ncbi:hypothetical protein [Halalkalibacter okhensis]|uniref:Uncharacterized protein n=1 Tax=Halalkalibacter okhensis TaxID=333138 RepID=A0A0B0IL69_9BACI|nr:hypothetical protein [Halalkalibacter okhensis]KHF40371.1 hypothetical protein LQ50_10285 [Halalkalibacter okhensis]